MDLLMNRLTQIRDECLPENEKEKGKKKEKVDPFAAAKNKINGELRDIRNLIKERDKQEAENPGTTYTVELAHHVRVALSAVQEDAAKMNQDFAAKKKKYEAKAAKAKKRDENLDGQMKLREEVLHVISDHINECSQLEKKRYGGGNVGTTVGSTSGQQDPTVTALPDIDDPRFQQLIKNDHEIDELIEVLGKNVHQLKEMAHSMHDEAVAQGEILDQLDVEVTKADAKLTNLNARLKTIVEKARPGNKFCVDFILIIVLLGLGGAIYTIIKSRW